MKNFFRITALAFLLVLSSCGKDDAPIGEDLDKAAEKLENTPLGADSISDNVIIKGGTKEEGMPPTPNEAISLDLSNSGKVAFLNKGFELSLTSDGAITGAYIQFKGNDGTVASSYYDIDLSANEISYKRAKRTKLKRYGPKFFKSSKDNEETLDVGFNEKITAGTFCYLIYVYDATGNVSAPKEVCTIVESWGGNEKAIGKWHLDKWFNDNDLERVYLEGVENCINEEREIVCQGLSYGNTAYESCELSEYWDIELNEDGTYIEKEKLISKNTYTDFPQNPCLEEPDLQEVYTFESTGKWAYLNEEEKFVFIEYSYKEVYKGEVVGSDEAPKGEVYYGFGNYNGVVKLIGDNLVIDSFEERTTYFKK